MNKPYLIIGKEDIILPIDLLSESSSSEVKSLLTQGFVILFENCEAESSEQALKIWRSQKISISEYNHIRTSTSSFILPNITIIENKGVITASVVAGTNILSDFFARFSNIFGGKSSAYVAEIDNIKEQALKELRKKADALSCNAIINISIDVDEISGNNKSMLMVTAVGTAVTIIEQ